MVIVVAIFGALVTLTVAQVFMRYVVGHAFMWGDELMRVLLIWGVLLAGGLAFYYHRHLALELRVQGLPPGYCPAVEAVNDGVIRARHDRQRPAIGQDGLNQPWLDSGLK